MVNIKHLAVYILQKDLCLMSGTARPSVDLKIVPDFLALGLNV